MATSKDISFILVPGSFATPALYDTLIALLHEKGYDAKAIELLSANDGTRMPPLTMEDDAAHIRAAVTSVLDDATNPKSVVLATHSYGGIPGASSLKGLSKAGRSAEGKTTAVTGIVFIGAFVAAEGQSVRDIMTEFDAMPEPYKSGVPGGYMPTIDGEFAPLIFNDIESPADAAKFHSLMTRHSSDSYNGKLSYEAWKDIPSVQIIPGKDMVVPVPVQEAMYERAAAAGGKVKRVFVEGAGHAITNSRTELVVNEMIRMSAGSD